MAKLKLELSKDVLKKNVGVVHTTGTLSLLERKISNVLLLNAYDNLLKNRTHSLRVGYLTALLGWTESNNIADLKDALKKITSTTIEFNLMKDGKETWKIMSMLSFAEIEEGVCRYRYDEYLAEKLFNPEIYATINLSIQREFKRGYALTLYENCVRYKNVGSTGWIEIPVFRKLMGADSSLYDEFKYLKHKVINKSIEEINSVSDIKIEAEYSKEGRKIAFVKFIIKENNPQTLFALNLDNEHSEIKQSESYKRLMNHGIGPRLAIQWLLEDKDGIENIIEYVEAQDRRKKVRGSTAGFIRRLVEDKAQVGKKTPYELEKEKRQQDKQKSITKEKIDDKKRELEIEYKKSLVTSHIKNIDFDELKNLVSKYRVIFGDKKIDSCDPETLKITNSIQRIGFNTWLRSEISKEVTFNKRDFDEWISKKAKQ
jgi:hypothetical protein